MTWGAATATAGHTAVGVSHDTPRHVPVSDVVGNPPTTRTPFTIFLLPPPYRITTVIHVSEVLLLAVAPTSGVPIYRQVADQVRARVLGGRLAAGAFVPSVRQVAEHLQINPMTVSKAYSLLEREGVVELVRGQGMRVSST